MWITSKVWSKYDGLELRDLCFLLLHPGGADRFLQTLPWKGRGPCSAGLSDVAKANVEALASVNGTLPNECDNCGTMGTSFCCNYYFNGQFITLYHLFVGPDDPIFD